MVRLDELCLCNKHGQALESFPLSSVSWLPCALPGREHCLSLQVAADRPRELILKAPSRARVLDLVAQLDSAASQQLAQRSLSEVIQSQHEASRERELWRGPEGEEAEKAVEVEASPTGTQQQQQQQARDASAPRLATGPLSFVGRVRGSGGAGGCSSCPSSPSSSDSSRCGSPDSPTALPPSSPLASPLPSAAAAAAAARLQLPSPAVFGPAGGPLGEPAASQVAASAGLAAITTLPVRLLSFGGGRQEGKVASHVEALERAVSQLSREVASSRGNSPTKALLSDVPLQAMAEQRRAQQWPRSPAPVPSSPARQQLPAGCDTAGSAAVDAVQAGQPAGPSANQHPPGSPRGPTKAPHATVAAQRGGSPAAAGAPVESALPAATSSNSSATPYHFQRLLVENEAVSRRAGELEGALQAARAQLAVAAADNVRLGQEAARAVRELQAAATAAAGGRGREQQLQAALEGAIQRCEQVGRELALLTGQLERRAETCEQLKRAVEELETDKTVLTAALTTAQVQLKDATPAGFQGRAAALQQAAATACEEARAEREKAAAAEREAAGAAVRLAESQKREAQVAEHIQQAARLVEEARGARQAGLARERQLAAEVEALRAQEALRLQRLRDAAAGSQEPLARLQEQVDALAEEKEELLSQVDELRRVGQELGRSCSKLEASLQQAVSERDATRAALSQAQQAQQVAAQQWAAERAGLQGQLAGTAQRLHGSEDSVHGSRGALAVLQSQLDAARQDLADARQRSCTREQELQAELRLAGVKSEGEVRALKDRLEAALSAHSAAAAAAAEREAGREAAAAAARREAEAAQSEARRLQGELARLRDEHAVSMRQLQLEVSSLKADHARLAQEAAQAQTSLAAVKDSLAAAERQAQQAQAQLAAAASSQAGLSQERKELQARLDRLAVEKDRTIRERDALELRLASTKQQYKLLEAVAAQDLNLKAVMRGVGSARLAAEAESKENGVVGRDAVAGFMIKAGRSPRRGNSHGVLLDASPSYSD
ncbi:hypothetical protein N2152v2_003944 [Parachlorella kessleri]